MGWPGRWIALISLYAAYPVFAFAGAMENGACQGELCSETLKVGVGEMTFELTTDIVIAILAAFVAMVFIARRQNGQNPEVERDKEPDMTVSVYRKRPRGGRLVKE